MWVEPGDFGFVVGAQPTELLRNKSIKEYLINIKIENMLYGLCENVYIEFFRNSQQAFAYIISFNFSLSQKHRTVGLNRWKLIWTDVLVGKIGPDVRWLRWLGFKFYFPYYWILLPPAIFNANDFVPEVCGRRKNATIKRKTMRKTGSQEFLTSGGGRDGVWAFLQDIIQITQRILVKR